MFGFSVKFFLFYVIYILYLNLYLVLPSQNDCEKNSFCKPLEKEEKAANQK